MKPLFNLINVFGKKRIHFLCFGPTSLETSIYFSGCLLGQSTCNSHAGWNEAHIPWYLLYTIFSNMKQTSAWKLPLKSTLKWYTYSPHLIQCTGNTTLCLVVVGATSPVEGTDILLRCLDSFAFQSLSLPHQKSLGLKCMSLLNMNMINQHLYFRIVPSSKPANAPYRSISLYIHLDF